MDAAYREDLAGWIRVQQEAGLDYFSDGLFRWQDIFRPLAEGLGPKKPEELVRWFDTNTFFRAPEVTSVDSPSVSGVIPDASVPRPRVVTLPSPYTFSRATRQAANRNQLMKDLAERVLRPAIHAVHDEGASLIHLEEPWLIYYGIDNADWKPFEDALATLDVDGVKIILHCYFGDAGPYFDRLARMPVTAIGVDLIETDIDQLGKRRSDKALLLGCIDGRNSVLEPAAGIVELIQRIAETASPADLYLSSNCELQYLPTQVAASKVRRLGEVAQKAKGLVKV